MPAPEFVWVGDLDDDCTCRSVPGYVLRAELLSDGTDPDDPCDVPAWYAAVYREGRTGKWGVDTVFHNDDADVNPKTAKAARNLCEMAVLADLFRRGESP